MLGGTSKPVQEEDPMDALIREAREDDLSLDFEQLLEEDEPPEWDDVPAAPQASISVISSTNHFQNISQVPCIPLFRLISSCKTYRWKLLPLSQ